MEYIIYLTLFIVIMRIMYFLIGSIIEKRKGLNLNAFENLPFVSIVVPARNEEKNIERCIISIAASDYPVEKFEIITVNDRSEDKTLEILKKLKSRYLNLKIINKSEDDNNKNLRGKPGALQSGIEVAQSDIILMTDADCTVHPKWIRTISSFFADPEMGLVAGYTAIRGDNTFAKIQACEWTYLHTLATAGIGWDQPFSCYGNNLAIRKKYFDEIGGYHSVKFSVTEDLALLQAIHKHNKKLRHLTHEYCTVTTDACPTLKDYLRQHHRWIIGALDLGVKAFLWVVSSLAFWIGLIVSLITSNFLLAIAFFIIRLIGDALLTLPNAKILKQKGLNKWMFPAELFFILMELAAPFFLLKKDVKWKGQTFN